MADIRLLSLNFECSYSPYGKVFLKSFRGVISVRRYIDLWYIHDECDLDQDGMVDIEVIDLIFF